MKKRTTKLTGFMLFITLLLACPVQAQVTIGSGEEPDSSAVLDLRSQDSLGLLLPRVRLVSTSSFVPLGKASRHKAGMMVYNLATSKDVTPGTYYNDGSKWIRLGLLSGQAGNAVLQCSQAAFDPGQILKYGTAVLPGTVINIPYTGGNGGVYNGATIMSTDPESTIKAKIESGILANGSGTLSFTVLENSYPSQEEAKIGNPVNLNLQPFFSANPVFDTACKVISVGYELKAEVLRTATIDNLRWTDEDGVEGYSCQLTSADGRFSVRAFILSNDEYDSYSSTVGSDGAYGINLQIRNNTNSTITIGGQYTYFWNGVGSVGQSFLNLKSGVWSGDNALDGQYPATENPNNHIWYAPYVCPPGSTGYAADPENPVSIESNRECGLSIHWGNDGVYAAAAPERRIYSWSINDGAQTKTAYILTFSSVAKHPEYEANIEHCPNGVCTDTQIFMMIETILAY